MIMKRIAAVVVGTIIIGIAVGFYRLSMFGVDAFTCMNLGVSGFIGMSFGNWQLIVNSCLLVVMFFAMRRLIGIGTAINMIAVGYVADITHWIILNVFSFEAVLAVRIVYLALGTLCVSFGAALYMGADMGTSPYDSVALLLVKWSRDKLSFRLARVIGDVVVTIVGVSFCIIGDGEIAEVIGIGTLLNAFCNGPLIQFFRTKFVDKWLGKAAA